MAQRYNQGFNYTGATHFDAAPLSEVEFSSMTVDPTWYVPINGGDIVPCFYEEVLPHSTFEFDLDFVIRQLSASIRPTMGKMQVDIFCFFVPNRVINESWRNVTGENTSGFWNAPEIELAPLVASPTGSTQIPVDSIADLYGLPSQQAIPNVVLSQMNDLKQRGYLCIYNEYFRDQNYQPLKAFSKLNIYEGFMERVGTSIGLEGTGGSVNPGQRSDGSYPDGAVVKALYGDGSVAITNISGFSRLTNFSFLGKPLKANKLHDAFTSVLPAPQKGPEVVFSVAGELPVEFNLTDTLTTLSGGISNGIRLAFDGGSPESGRASVLYNDVPSSGQIRRGLTTDLVSDFGATGKAIGWNVQGVVDLADSVGVSINDLRMSVATQQVLELLARGGSRYWSFLKSFFGVEAENPFPDIPTQIGHIRRDLDLYQVAQTSASVEDGSPQGSLTAFGYTTKGGALFTKTFIEHGYIHCFAVIRQRNIYPSLCMPDNFRRRTLDFYLPQFANIGEQPIRTAILNPFKDDSMETALGYQEAFWEYRYSPDRVLGSLRPGVVNSLDVWHFGDYDDTEFTHVNGDWLVSNAQEVLDRTLYVTSEVSPQFIGQFNWRIKKQLPMPIYSVPGLDMI